MKITLTRHFSGFNNVSDTWKIGNTETTDSAVYEAELPAGYGLGKTQILEEDVIIDPAGHSCTIVHHSSGKPQLISLSGPVKEQPVLDLTA
jgi:hypothetical protein